MRNMILFFILLGIGYGIFGSASGNGSIHPDDLRDIVKFVKKQAMQTYCPTDWRDASPDDIYDMLVEEAESYDYTEGEITGSRRDLNRHAGIIHEQLHGRCNHVVRLNDGSPDADQVRISGPTQEEQAERDEKFDKVLGIVGASTDSAMEHLAE